MNKAPAAIGGKKEDNGNEQSKRRGVFFLNYKST